MKAVHFQSIATQLGIKDSAVRNTIVLLKGGATIPFIARYRKEATDSLDEVQIARIKELSDKFEELEKRKQTVLNTLLSQNQLTKDLKLRIENCYDPVELEDIYLPFKPKRKTRAAVARERGLEPLAKILMEQSEKDPESRAFVFLNNNVKTVGEALSGARDIIAEWINENEEARNIVRRSFETGAVIEVKVIKNKEEEGEKYRDYFDFSEPLKKCPSHRLLAIRRGENEGFLKVSVSPDEKGTIERLEHIFIRGKNLSSKEVLKAINESYRRLLKPSVETGFARLLKEKADTEAIRVFSENLRQLLLAPPLGRKRVLAIDPGYRTGCKVVCLDELGNLLHNETIYPHKPQEEKKMAAKKITSMASSYKIEAIAVGNDREIRVYIVSEDGASVYSASSVAREEFPQYDVTVRGAISIGRRLIDPLAELVKIDPKSIGVGQYQHDVDQTKLKAALDSVVESCVNKVGVNLNTAGKYLLTYVSGLGPQLAQNIVDYRNENGMFKSRDELMKVPRMGPKAFEQSAGFLRIPEGGNPLDNSAVHPESYHLVETIARDMNCTVSDLIGNEEKLSWVDLKKFVSEKTGLPTLNDIKTELSKPGRDPRKIIKVFEFAEDIFKIEDLKPGMILPGIINNITRFGAFVDIGIKQSGLIHVSQLAERFVTDPNEIVKLHQHVIVKVIEIDIPRNRIQLSLKQVKQN